MIKRWTDEPLTVRAKVYGVPTVFMWRGGAYVDIMPLGECVEVINVWNQEANRAAICSRADLRRVAMEWMGELDRHTWIHHYCAKLVPCDCRWCSRRRSR